MSNRNYFQRKFHLTIVSFILMVVIVLFSQCGNSVKNDLMSVDRPNTKDSCCLKGKAREGDTLLQTEVTCPNCGYKKTETMPTDVCVIKYNCEECKIELHPKEGDCCVFCTYSTHKCPSMQ